MHFRIGQKSNMLSICQNYTAEQNVYHKTCVGYVLQYFKNVMENPITFSLGSSCDAKFWVGLHNYFTSLYHSIALHKHFR